jgi:hypothetical protein
LKSLMCDSGISCNLYPIGNLSTSRDDIMGINGESQDRNHKKWIDERGADSSFTEQPAAEAEGGIDGHGSSDPGRAADNSSKGGPVNVTTIVLVGLMLLALGAVAVIANNNKRSDSAPEEIVFEPEEVSLDEGSATLKIEYDSSVLGFKSKGADDISLFIKPYEDPKTIEVTGYLSSTQRVDVSAMDQGNECWYNIFHNVDYRVAGNFSSAECKFELSVVMSPTSSKMLSHNCSFDPGLPIESFYMAPPPEKLVFTKSFAGPALSSTDYSFLLVDVLLPRGVNCPAFSQ